MLVIQISLFSIKRTDTKLNKQFSIIKNMSRLILETKRLALYEYCPEDAPFIFVLFNTPKWIKFIGDRNIKTLKDAENFIINSYMKGYATNGFGLYKVVLKESNTPIGTSGIVNRANLEGMDLGYALLPEFEGHGYITEANEAVLNIAKEKYNIATMSAILLEENTESISVLERLEFKKMGIVLLEGDKEEMLIYSIKL